MLFIFECQRDFKIFRFNLNLTCKLQLNHTKPLKIVSMLIIKALTRKYAFKKQIDVGFTFLENEKLIFLIKNNSKYLWKIYKNAYIFIYCT